jgi:hypothetical protein
MEKILLAGPWVGEFGWELFCWQGYVRKLSKNYDKTIVIGRPNQKLLYEDFCDEYIDFDPKGFKTDSWSCHDCIKPNDLINKIPHTDYLDGNFDIGFRYGQNGAFDIKGLFNQQEFIKYQSNSLNCGYDIIFHCRNKSTGSDRNWEKEQWVELFNLLGYDFKIACIGNAEAFHINGSDDLRGISLSDLVSVMNNSKLIIGPSSGPMHLASLSGLKHLVWSSEHNRDRYLKVWNPFNTDVIFYSNEEWNPKPKNIYNIITNELKYVEQ